MSTDTAPRLARMTLDNGAFRVGVQQGRAGRELRSKLAHQVLDARAAGLLPIVTTTPRPPLHQAHQFVLELSRAVGDVLPQGSDGEPIREVRDRGRTLKESTARYSDTRFGGDLHTDGFHRPGTVPDLFTLYCHQAAKVGGALVLVHIADVLERLDDATIDVLSQPFTIATRGGDPAVVTRNILDVEKEVWRVHYMRQYVTGSASGSATTPLGEEQEQAFDVLDGVLADESLHRNLRLEAGEMAFVDNLRFIHGRTEFVDHSEPERARLLLRTWIVTGPGTG